MKKLFLLLALVAITTASCTVTKKSGCPTSLTGDPGGRFKG